jgi:hypothetical protein
MAAVGDRVKLVAFPSWAARLPEESQAVFRLCVGKTFRVREIDEHGHLELWTLEGKDTSQMARADILLVDQEDVEVVTRAQLPHDH